MHILRLKHIKIGVVITVIVTTILSGLLMTGSLSRAPAEVVLMEVDYFGTWEGTITQADSSRKVSGFGKKRVILQRDNWDSYNLTIRIKKIGYDTNQLRVRIMLINGTVLKGASTNDSFGIVEVSYIST